MKINCKIAKQIYKSLEEYDLEDLFDKEKFNNLNRIRKDFIKKFSKEYILNKMTLKQYVEADGNKNNFCYIIERKLRGWGSILGSTNRKFGIYKDGKKYKSTDVWDKKRRNAKVGFKRLKTSIVDLLDSGKIKDYDSIENNKLSPMFKSVILSIYYDKDYIAINKNDDVDLFLQKLQINYDKDIYNTFEKKKALLLEVKNNMKEFKGKSNFYFMRFLYKFVKRGSIANSKVKVPKIDSSKISSVDWQYLQKHKKDVKNENSRIRKIDYEKVYQYKKSIGESGERAILSFEKNKLKKLGLTSLANKVKKVSDKDDSIGYDILSYDEKGKEIHIEVKTKSSKKEILDFVLTDNELEKTRKDSRHKIYYLFDIRSKNPKLHIVDKKQFKDEYLKPILYSVVVDVKRIIKKKI